MHQYFEDYTAALRKKARRSQAGLWSRLAPKAPKAVRRSGHRAPVCNHAGAYYSCAFSDAMGTCLVPFVRHCCQFATTAEATPRRIAARAQKLPARRRGRQHKRKSPAAGQYAAGDYSDEHLGWASAQRRLVQIVDSRHANSKVPSIIPQSATFLVEFRQRPCPRCYNQKTSAVARWRLR